MPVECAQAAGFTVTIAAHIGAGKLLLSTIFHCAGGYFGRLHLAGEECEVFGTGPVPS